MNVDQDRSIHRHIDVGILRRNPRGPDIVGLSLRQWLWWYLLELPCYLWLSICYRFRSWGAGHVPKRGATLLVSNHQSYLDPIALGVAGHRRPFHAMARSSLFRNRFLGWLIGSLRAIAVSRDESDMTAMRRCIKVLREGRALVVFPEGARTPDGMTRRFAPGTMLLIKRARPIVVPVAIDGSHLAWPRQRLLPRLSGRIAVMYGRPICADDLLAMGADRALEMLRQQVETMRLELARRRPRSRSD